MEEKNKNQLNEPSFAYGKKRIKFFSSLEEENEYNHRYDANLTPEERLREVTQLIKTIFREELKKNPTLGNRIYFS
ncbi:MAG TPA: hypothetical protein VE978_01630 [Chitinophagales bacterium]|nr:hypothetical protein [Chitinophagales bacterium]